PRAVVAQRLQGRPLAVDGGVRELAAVSLGEVVPFALQRLRRVNQFLPRDAQRGQGEPVRQLDDRQGPRRASTSNQMTRARGESSTGHSGRPGQSGSLKLRGRLPGLPSASFWATGLGFRPRMDASIVRAQLSSAKNAAERAKLAVRDSLEAVPLFILP